MKNRDILLTLLSVFLSCFAGVTKGNDETAASRQLKIAFITDTHYGPSLNITHIERCIADINSLDSVDFVLIGGDVSESGTNEQIAGAKSAFDKLRPPYYVVSGNHDSKWSESGCTAYRETFGYEHFEFEAGGYRFLGCSSGPDMRMAPALIPFGCMEWLKSLKPGKPVIFLNHYPLHGSMSNWFEARRELIRLDCRLAIGGHVHYNKAWDYHGLPGITGRASKVKGDYTAYNIITIRNSVVNVSERHVYPDHAMTQSPWFTTELLPVTDQLNYDVDGLPEGHAFPYSGNAGYKQVKTLWKRSETANIACGFAVRDSMAWYATDSGKVAALSVTSGNILWSRKFEGRIYSTPDESHGILVFGCTDGAIYGLSAADGRTLWKHSTGSAIVACPTIRDERIYIGSSDGIFRCLELKDGRILWKCTGIEGYCDAAPCVDGHQVVFGTWGGKLYSADIASGKLNWIWDSWPPAPPGACPPVISGKRIFIACPDRHTYCIDAETGKPLFLVDEGRESIAISEDKQTLYIKSMFGKVLAFDTHIPVHEVTGTYSPDSRGLWQPDIPVIQPSQTKWYVESGIGKDIGSSSLTVCGDLLLIPSDKGTIHAIDRFTGTPQWVHRVGIGLVNPISAWSAEGKTHVLASTTDGKITLLEVSE